MIRRPAYFVGVIVLACFSALLGMPGCAITRPSLTKDQLEQRRVEYFKETALELNDASRKLAGRIKSKWDAYRAGRTATPPELDILIISGGGTKGAFGASFLDAWGSVTDPALSRPDFDVVTGVSTGAIIAPFAFIGDESTYHHIADLYAEPKDDWVKLRDIFFFLPGRESFLNISGLQKEITAAFGPEVIHQVAERSKEGRVLAVGATNLDLGILKPWYLGAQCEIADQTGDPSRVHKIIMASSAIPAAFPPVVIDDTLYVDGGTTSNILFDADLRAPGGLLKVLNELYPGVPPPKIRYWVVINNQLGAAPRIVQPTWVSITASSIETAIRSSTIGALRQLDMQLRSLREKEGVDCELRFVAIPGDWRAPKQGLMFEKENMQSLAEIGRRMGAKPESWRTNLADVPEATGRFVPEDLGSPVQKRTP